MIREIVAEKSVTEQVLDLPVGSVVLVDQDGMDYVLHRTGVDGWLRTRELFVSGIGEPGAYANNDYIRKWINARLGAVRVYLLREGVPR